MGGGKEWSAIPGTWVATTQGLMSFLISSVAVERSTSSKFSRKDLTDASRLLYAIAGLIIIAGSYFLANGLTSALAQGAGWGGQMPGGVFLLGFGAAVALFAKAVGS